MSALPGSKSKDLLPAILLVILCAGCESVNIPQSQAPESRGPGLDSPTQETSIYRYLSGVANAYPDAKALTGLCIRQHGFQLTLPSKAIRTAHNISLPASDEWVEYEQVERQAFKTVVIQPPPVNGIIMQPIEKRIPYGVKESQELRKNISGTCLGTEYIVLE